MNIPSGISAEPVKMCFSCGESRTLSSFRRLRTGSEDRHRICRRCHNREETQRRIRKRESERLLAIGKAGTQLSASGTVDDAARVLNALAASFGGRGRLTNWWSRTAFQLRDDRPHLFLKFIQALRHCEDLWRFEQVSAAEYFATEEGKSFLRREILRMVKTHPELIIAAEQELSHRNEKRSPKDV
jgi:hypothetical protein